MTQATAVPAMNQGVAALLARSVLFSVNVGRFGNTRKVSSSQVEVDADKTRINVSKSLLDCLEYRAIRTLDGEIRNYLYSRALPSPFKAGLYMLPVELVAEVEDRMAAFATARQALIDQFAEAYPEEIRKAQIALRGTFDPSDYPSTEVMVRYFVLGWQYLSLTAPENLPPTLFEREREKITQQWGQALEDAKSILRVAMAGQVEHAIDRLAGTKDGKPRIFRDTMITNMEDFLSTFDARNLTGDDELAAVVGRARSLLRGVSPHQLRDSADLRARVQAGFIQVKEQMDAMMVDAPSRRINLNDDD